MLRASAQCGEPDASTTSGLVLYVDDEPAGWVAVEARTAYPKLRTLRVPWTGRTEDKDDDRVWAVTCFAVRKGFRGQRSAVSSRASTSECSIARRQLQRGRPRSTL